ncbi:MAG: glycoside hydrolase, partial [Bryobacteraceae bacterium]
APGTYTVRLTANGQSMTQPIVIKMDPRVKITPEVTQIFTLTTKIEDEAHSALAAYKEARETLEKLKARPQSAANDAVIKKVEELAPAPVEAPAGGGGRGGRGGFGEPAPPANLSNIASQLVAAVEGTQAAEMAPTATQLQACTKAEAAYTALMTKWAAVKTEAGSK